MSEEWYRAQQQFRCPACDVPVDGVSKHADGCAWQAEQHRLMQNTVPNYGSALMNAACESTAYNANNPRWQLDHASPEPRPSALERIAAWFRRNF
jgi:hypothetical protein